MKGWDRIEVDIDLQVIATLNWDRCGAIGIGCAVVVRGRIDNVQRSCNTRGRIARAFGGRRSKVHGIPGSCCNGQLVIPGSQSRKLVGTLIVSRTAAGRRKSSLRSLQRELARLKRTEFKVPNLGGDHPHYVGGIPSIDERNASFSERRPGE